MTEVGAGAIAGLAAGALADALLEEAGGVTGAGFVVSGLTALLEITNLRRTGGVLTFGALGELPRLVRGADLGAVALRFNIKYQTEKYCAGSELNPCPPEMAASDETPEFLAV